MRLPLILAASTAAAAVLLVGNDELPSHAECALFTEKGASMRRQASLDGTRAGYRQSNLTVQVTGLLSGPNRIIPGGSRTDIYQQYEQLGPIDSQIFKAMADAGITPAPRTNDYEFIRRVTLDLTGRVPTGEAVAAFVASPDPAKRAQLIDALIATPEFTDKWTMFFGDLFKNTTRNTQVVRYAEGRNAFHAWIKDAVATNKSYDKMATELIAVDSANSWEDGAANWLVGSFVTGSPRGGQDIYDQQAADVAETFLGNAHMNCILCHDGRRHLDTLSVWGKQATRLESYGLSAFFAKTAMQRRNVSQQPLRYYWSITDNPRTPDYPLNTTTGNRPERRPIGTIANVTPQYPFTGEKPVSGEDYRSALARMLVKDIQFSRTIVNYMWKAFFGRGIVEPANQFDPMRLDPSTPPPDGWTVQPTHPQLLDELARDFQEHNYDLRWLIKSIAASETYQLSSTYSGTWKPEYEKFFARKFVRRLWGEEVLDSIVQISNLPNRMNLVRDDPNPLFWAMQLPEPALPGGGVGSFLDSFMRGNRDSEDRRSDGSVPQTLNLMNDTLVVSRTRASGTGAAASFARQLLTKYPQAAMNQQLIAGMFLTVLSRPATEAEMSTAMAALAAGTTNNLRQQKVEDLLWALFNKVDFVFNY
ncbi:MAG TPA: DUF1549 domain-containing protein [Bryobacteraceae bacterium]|nr:DUF1549 domain-containing protein [Bryobacteraceae bacterium]